jgi:hypothetical protein
LEFAGKIFVEEFDKSLAGNGLGGLACILRGHFVSGGK